MRTLTTDRLVLKPWEQDFEGDLLRFASDQRVMRFIGDGKPWEREFTVQRHQALLEHWQQHGFGWRGIFGDDGAFLGVAALSYLGTLVPGIEESAIEIGWWVDPAAWGKGIATEAAVALRDEAFGSLDAQRIVARFVPANHASERVMIKLGMRVHGDATGRKGEAVGVYDLDRTGWMATTEQ